LDKNFLQILGISLLAAFIFSALFYVGFLGSLQLSLSNGFFIEKKPLENILIIAVDDESLQEIGRWPWSRSKFVELIKLIPKSSVIGLDISFFEESNEMDDNELGNAIANHGRVVLPVEFTSFSVRDGKLFGEGLLKPIPALKNSLLGYTHFFTDSDGITRSFAMQLQGEKHFESFALVVLKQFLQNQSISFNEINQDKALINFFGRPGTFQRISFSKALTLDAAVFEDKIILIGATAPDLHDESLVPISPGKPMPGVEINANLIQTLLTRDFLSNQGFSSTMLVIFVLSILSGLILFRFRVLIATLLVLTLAMAFVVSAVIVFNSFGVILNFLHPLLSIAFVFIGVMTFNYVTEKKRRQWVTNIFGKYVSEEVAREILEKTSKDKVKLEGSKRVITVMFADIRGFTSISEKLSPEKVVSMLNYYLSSMTDIVLENKGTLDKYAGDEIMALFNVPLGQEDHAFKAIKVALEMQEAIKELGRKTEFPGIKYGIGINTGEAIVGNIGSEKRMDYTAIGDAVNIASRLCSQAKPDQVLISESTYNLAKEKIIAKKIGKIKVKGKAKPLLVYQAIKIK